MDHLGGRTDRCGEDGAAACRCAEEYARRWPTMPASELAVVHHPVCPVRLERLAQERRRAVRGGRLR